MMNCQHKTSVNITCLHPDACTFDQLITPKNSVLQTISMICPLLDNPQCSINSLMVHKNKINFVSQKEHSKEQRLHDIAINNLLHRFFLRLKEAN